MAGWYTDIPVLMLFHGRVVHRRTSSNVVPSPGGTRRTSSNVVLGPGGTPTYQFECCTMAGWYTDVPV